MSSPSLAALPFLLRQGNRKTKAHCRKRPATSLAAGLFLLNPKKMWFGLFWHAKPSKNIKEFMNNENQMPEVTVEVTEGEYQTDLARGLAEDEVLQPGRHKFQRGTFLTRHGLTPEPRVIPAKVRVSIALDQDVLTFIKDRAAAATNDAAYETQINAILRAVMEEEAKVHAMPLSSQAEAAVR